MPPTVLRPTGITSVLRPSAKWRSPSTASRSTVLKTGREDAVASHHGVYEEDRQPIELGVCHAHNGQGGTFHYHADANCLHWHPDAGEGMLDYNISTPAAVAENTANGSHSAVIGVAMDGYPIYGLWGYDDQMNIVKMKSSYKLKDGETGYNGIDDYIYLEARPPRCVQRPFRTHARVPRWHLSLPFHHDER